MDSTIEQVETDSTIDFELVATETDHLVEPSDPEVEFRAQTRQQGEGQLLAGTADVVIEGPRTDADGYQVTDPNVGHRVGGLAPRYQLPATPPTAASETRADRRAHSTPYPLEVVESRPLPSLSGAMVTEVGQVGRTGNTSGGFVDPCPPRQLAERPVTSNLGETIPVTTGARTSTTATITSTYVTCSTVGGSAYVQDGRMPPSVVLTSMRPARQVFVSQPSQSIEPSGGFPRARDSLGTLRPEFKNGRTNWGDCIARSDVPPGVNRVPVVNGLGDRAVYPVPPGECYQSRGPEGNPVVLERAVTFAAEYRDDGTVMTVQYWPMVSAAAEAGGAPHPGARHPGSVPVWIGPEPPYLPVCLREEGSKHPVTSVRFVHPVQCTPVLRESTCLRGMF